MFRNLFKIKNKVHFGRFDIHTTEKQKFNKMILANADNCGDFICGKPIVVKNIINIDDNFPTKKEKPINDPQLCCMFYDFTKCNNCFMD